MCSRLAPGAHPGNRRADHPHEHREYGFAEREYAADDLAADAAGGADTTVLIVSPSGSAGQAVREQV